MSGSDDRRQAMVALLRETARLHHLAYQATDGDDPDWPLWYAGRMQAALAGIMAAPVTRSELVFLLVSAERAHRAAPERPWPEFYTDYLLHALGPRRD